MFFDLPMLAIDIGSSAIKIIEMSGITPVKKLRTVGIELLPHGAVQGGIINDARAVEATLRRLIKKLKIRTRGRRAAVSLGGSNVIIKKAKFPANTDPTELSETVYYEAEQHFQTDINDLYFDFYRVPAAQNSSEASVVLVGAKREIVESYLNVVKSLGLKIGVVDCDVFALTNMLEYSYGRIDGLHAIANIGSASTQVSLIANGQYLYTRDVLIGGENYSRNIAAKLGISVENAEAVKISASLGDGAVQPDIHKIIGEVNESLVSEIQMTFDFFFKSGEAPVEYQAVQSIFLAGGGSKTLGLDAAVAATLHIPVYIVNPFQKVELPKRFPMDKLLSQGHLYSVAVGLSLRIFDEGNKS